MSNLNSLLHNPIQSTPIRFNQWDGIEGSFVSILWNSLKSNGIDPTKVFIQKTIGSKVDVWGIGYESKRRTIKRSTGVSAESIVNIVTKMK